MFTEILVFGASNSYGAWDEEGGWFSRLRKFLDKEKRRGYDNFYFVYNLGISGNTSENLINRFETETKDRIEPDTDEIILIFDIGKNDAAFLKDKNSNWVPIDKFKENITTLINQSKKISNNIIFLGIVYEINESIVNPWQDDFCYYVKDLTNYNETIKNICAENKVAFIDIQEKLYGDNFLSEDGLHLNSSGHQKIFEIVKDYLINNKMI